MAVIIENISVNSSAAVTSTRLPPSYTVLDDTVEGTAASGSRGSRVIADFRGGLSPVVARARELIPFQSSHLKVDTGEALTGARVMGCPTVLPVGHGLASLGTTTWHVKSGSSASLFIWHDSRISGAPCCTLLFLCLVWTPRLIGENWCTERK